MSVLDPIAAPPVDHGALVGWCYAARVVRWIDGDTVVVDCLVDVGFEEMVTKRRRIRLLGVNTPEKNSADPSERLLAKAAQSYAETLAPAGSPVTVFVVKYDKYGGRDDGDVYHDDRNVATALIDADLGVPYDGGTR